MAAATAAAEKEEAQMAGLLSMDGSSRLCLCVWVDNTHATAVAVTVMVITYASE
jgi:hypothetical protein